MVKIEKCFLKGDSSGMACALGLKIILIKSFLIIKSINLFYFY
jgi:hypothetical protein